MIIRNRLSGEFSVKLSTRDFTPSAPGRSKPDTTRNSVLFPHPFGPIKAIAVTLPYLQINPARHLAAVVTRRRLVDLKNGLVGFHPVTKSQTKFDILRSRPPAAAFLLY
jgi:hypothetical protein